MDPLDHRIALSQQDLQALDELTRDYLPLIKKQIARVRDLPYEDRLSVAMLTFVGCVRQYTFGRGGFVAFVRTSIQNGKATLLQVTAGKYWTLQALSSTQPEVDMAVYKDRSVVEIQRIMCHDVSNETAVVPTPTIEPTALSTPMRTPAPTPTPRATATPTRTMHHEDGHADRHD